MLAGLLANALGYDRADSDRLQSLHDGMLYAAAITSEGALIGDLQIAHIDSRDLAWTTRGTPEGRKGKHGSSRSARIKSAWADASAFVSLRFAAPHGHDLDQVKSAMMFPARPLFIGRKAYLPTSPIFAGEQVSDTCLGALMQAVPDGLGYIWMAGDGPVTESPVRADGIIMAGHVFTAGGHMMHFDAGRMRSPSL